MTTISRRAFLQQIAFVGGTAATATPPPDAQHTLVCIFLRGGADTLNIVVPYDDDTYYRHRPTLAIAPPTRTGANASLKLDDRFAFHPLFKPLLPPFREGRLGIVNAVGSDNSSGSHFEAQDQLEHGESAQRHLDGGWLGRYLRSRNAVGSLAAVAIGPTIPESLRGAPTINAFRSIDEVQLPGSGHDREAIVTTLRDLYAKEPGLLGRQGRDTLALLGRVQALRDRPYRPEPAAHYGDDDFSGGLREIARLIKAQVGVQAACLDLDGWDTHFFQGTTDGLQATQIARLGTGLAAFDADMAPCRDRATVVVITEFGRRLYENASLGTDHGRGFALLAMGAGIHGGRVLGQWPGLEEPPLTQTPGVPIAPGPGGLTVRHDYRAVLAEIISGCTGQTVTADVFPGVTPGVGAATEFEPVGITAQV